MCLRSRQSSKSRDTRRAFFHRYKQESGGDLKLMMMGKPVIPVPKDRDIISLDFISEEMKYEGIIEAVSGNTSGIDLYTT